MQTPWSASSQKNSGNFLSPVMWKKRPFSWPTSLTTGTVATIVTMTGTMALLTGPTVHMTQLTHLHASTGPALVQALPTLPPMGIVTRSVMWKLIVTSSFRLQLCGALNRSICSKNLPSLSPATTPTSLFQKRST